MTETVSHPAVVAGAGVRCLRALPAEVLTAIRADGVCARRSVTITYQL
jgi:hypothetical protein